MRTLQALGAWAMSVTCPLNGTTETRASRRFMKDSPKSSTLW